MIFDVLVIGAGPAGSTAALLLANAGFSVAIVEKKEFPRRKVCGEFISATSFPLLERFGIAELYTKNSGPEVRRVGLFVGEALLTSKMPTLNIPAAKWGRAFGREHLDDELLKKAVAAGVKCWQPAKMVSEKHQPEFSTCQISLNSSITEISAQLIIDAAGSWERSDSRADANANKPNDLLAFKAHFKNCALPFDLMPLIAFPGGYGGLVNTDDNRVTLSCCIRRDTLQLARKRYPAMLAGEAVMQHISSSCRGVRKVFEFAKLEGNWLAAGPIRPGIRKCYKERIFYVGNIAGEAHPVVAEGISMAMQSAWILSEILIKYRERIFVKREFQMAAKAYTKYWHSYFAGRIQVAAIFAYIAMRPRLIGLTVPLFQLFPTLLSFAGKLSGKIKQVLPTNE